MVHRHAKFATLAAVAAVAIVEGQGRGNPTEWPTANADAQRTSWIRNDVSISPETMSHPPPRALDPGALRRDVSPKPGEGGQPGFELQWKTTLESPVRHGVSLGPGVITSGVNIFTPLSTIAAPSNRVFAIDNDTGNLFWTRRFEGQLPAGTAECPAGISGSLTRMVSLTSPEPGPGRGGGGRGRGSYSSAVGEPGAGVPIPSRGGGGRGTPAPATTPPASAPATTPPPAPAPASPTSSTIPPGQWRTSPFPTNAAAQGSWTGLFRPSGVVYAVSADGMFRTLGVVSGKDLQQPARFLPAGARFSDLIAVGDFLYTSTSHGCGGAADGVWAINIPGDKKVVSWKTNGGRPLGSVAFTTSGTVIVAVGPGTVSAGGHANAVVALDPKTLAVKDWYTQPGVEIVSPAVVFQEAGKDIVAVITKDGRILLLDAASLGGANHATPLFASSSLTGGAGTFAAQSPAMWQERTAVPSGAAGAPPASAPPPISEGARWLLIPVTGALPASLGAAANGTVSSGAVLAVKLARQDGQFSVQPGWVSQNIAAPLTPIVVNGVAFAASGPTDAPAGLYALHGTTGKTLWQSDKSITGPMSGRSFWVGSGHVFVGTQDGTVYAFGFAMERH